MLLGETAEKRVPIMPGLALLPLEADQPRRLSMHRAVFPGATLEDRISLAETGCCHLFGRVSAGLSATFLPFSWSKRGGGYAQAVPGSGGLHRPRPIQGRHLTKLTRTLNWPEMEWT